MTNPEHNHIERTKEFMRSKMYDTMTDEVKQMYKTAIWALDKALKQEN